MRAEGVRGVWAGGPGIGDSGQEPACASSGLLGCVSSTGDSWGIRGCQCDHHCVLFRWGIHVGEGRLAWHLYPSPGDTRMGSHPQAALAGPPAPSLAGSWHDCPR